MSAAQMPAKAPQVVYGTSEYIPSWAPDWSDADMAKPVTLNGEPLGFTVGDVLPSRRWAITKTGELLGQRDFERLWEQYVGMHVAGDKVVSIAASNKYFDVSKAPVPNASRYVNAAFDYQGKEIPIGFDPDKPATATEVKVYDARGDVVTAAPPPSANLFAKIEVLNNLKASGMLTAEQLAEQVALLTGSPTGSTIVAVEVPVGFAPAPAIDEADLTSPCGRVSGSKAGRMAHERNCSTCNPPQDEAA
jgi:hypothetical protein